MLATIPPSPVPSISIHFAAEELPAPEPASPFGRITFHASSPKLPSPLSPSYSRDDQLRSTHLLPPPLLSPKQAEQQQQQHLKAANAPSGGAGLDQARFQALLQASRSPTGTSKALDLRKEVAWKAHKSKQCQSCFLMPQGRVEVDAAQHTLSMQYRQLAFRALMACPCHCEAPIDPTGCPRNTRFSAASGARTSTGPLVDGSCQVHTVLCDSVHRSDRVPNPLMFRTRTNFALQLSAGPFSSPKSMPYHRPPQHPYR